MIRGQDAVAEILSSFDVILFDCDGVIYQGGALLPGVAEAMEVFKLKKITTKFITNTSSRSIEKMHAKFSQLGLSVSESDCFHSGVAVAHILVTEYPQVKKVYVIGESGLQTELERVGIECLGGPSDNNKQMTDEEFLRLSNDPILVDAVVVGYDMSFNFYKLARACLYFQKNVNCRFFAANSDITDKLGTFFIPGNGPALLSVQASISLIPGVVHKEPIIVGKPNPLFAQLVLHRSNLTHIKPERILVIGDRMDTDIALAKNCGFKSCLVLSGCTSESDLQNFPKPSLPDFLLSGLSCF